MSTENASNLCPQCGEAGQPVANVTATHIVKPAKKPEVGEYDVHLCKNPHCAVGYFNREQQMTIDKEDFRKPIWFKEGADPVYACYCKSITEGEVIRTVVESGLTDMKEIMLHLRGSLGSNCRKTNPAGHCCTQAFNEMIAKGVVVREALTKTPDLVVDSKAVDKNVLQEEASCTPTACSSPASDNAHASCSCS